MLRILPPWLLFLFAVSVVLADSAPESIPGIGPVGKAVRLHTGFTFTEGPAVDARGNVYFSDIPNNRIHRSDTDGKLSIFLEDSKAVNGLMFDARGRLVACQGGTKRLVAIDVDTKAITPLASAVNGKPLGTPNDVVIDRNGGSYFTAPDTREVYYVDNAGSVVLLPMKLARPNGVLLSPDEKTLYVLPSGSAEVMAYPVLGPGKVGDGKVLCKLIPNPKQPGRPGGDGLTVDTAGNLYLTRPSMKVIQVVAPDGKLLGLIPIPEEPSNCVFGGVDMKTLYVTAGTSVYTLPMQATGHRFARAERGGPLPEDWDYVGPMKKVAAGFRGREGVVIHVGGSMTIANPYGTWPRSGKGRTAEDRAILAWMHTDKKDSTDGWWLCRTEVKPYRAYTSESGLKAAMLAEGGKRGLPTLQKILDTYRPRMVTLECGIYDVEDGVSVADYRAQMGKALDRILASGAIPIVNTIPPFRARLEQTAEFNKALRALAKERGVPLIDLEREILSRRPTDWFGTLMKRIHLTAGEAGVNPGAEPTEENLKRSGYLLRGWLTVRKIAEIKQRVLDVAPLPGKVGTWIKRSPLPGAPVSPRLSYETSLAYDPIARRVIRWGGHAQGGIKGSGEQIAELWTLDPATMQWEHKEPNRSPPPACCAAQQVFDTAGNRFLRIRAASGSHGWHWFRALYLNNSSLWSYDLATNTWRDMRPLPEPTVGGAMACASWDSDREVVVAFGGEGSQDGTHLYDPYTNTWTRHSHKVQPMSPRSGGNLAYDAARKLHILFGSQFNDDPHTWAYDAAKNEWRDLKPTVQPPTARNDAVLAYDSVNQVILAVVRVGETDAKGQPAVGRLETWAYDAGKNTWTKQNPDREPDGHGFRSRVMTFVPDQNLFLLEASINPPQRVPGVEREQQVWTYRYADAKLAPLPAKTPRPRTAPRIVEDVVASVLSEKEVRLRWELPTGSEGMVRYHVERAPVEVFSEDEVIRLKRDTPPLPSPSVGAIKAIGPFERLTKEPIPTRNYVDKSIDLSKPTKVEGATLFHHRFRADQLDAKGKPYRYGVYAYRIRALNAKGAESGPSPYVLTIPSAPEDLFSKEEGEKCHLKWKPNREVGIQGYRIYWMKGPRPEGPGQATHRLREEPIRETTWTDEKAGTAVRRYWIVAVDGLGQEGTPSSPTWHYRTQREFYKPFVGAWHQ